jgi:hypothetical protein
MRDALQSNAGRSLLDLLVCDLPDDVVDAALMRPRDLGRGAPV